MQHIAINLLKKPEAKLTESANATTITIAFGSIAPDFNNYPYNVVKPLAILLSY